MAAQVTVGRPLWLAAQLSNYLPSLIAREALCIILSPSLVSCKRRATFSQNMFHPRSSRALAIFFF